MMTKKRKKDPNDDEKVKFCFRGSFKGLILMAIKKSSILQKSYLKCFEISDR